MGEFGVTPLWDFCRQHLRIRNKYVKEFIGEFIGTGLLCHYMVAVSIQHYFLQAAGEEPSSLEKTFGGILGIMTSVLITGGLSGAHINPAVSFGLAVAGKLSWPSLAVYMLGQFLGGYVGSMLGISIYYWPVKQTNLDVTQLVPEDVFIPKSSYGTLQVPFAISFYDQILCSIILLMAVCGLLDKRNMQIPKHMLGFFFCLVVAGISFAMGLNFGAYMNPARDLCPRLAALTIGYEAEKIFTPLDKQQWASGFFAPFIGAFVGVLIYIFFIGAHLDETEEELRAGPNSKEGDWRSTRFIPKAQIQNQSIYNGSQGVPASPTYGVNNNYEPPAPAQTFANPNVNYGPRDDMRYRQGY